MNDLPIQLSQHFARIGIAVDQPAEKTLEQLRALMGPARFEEFMALSGDTRSGASQLRVYEGIRDLGEANLLAGLEAPVTLQTAQWLYRKAAPRLAPGMRVIELGCWTGALASFVAAHHPQCSVVGVDRVPQIIEAAAAHHQLDNLSFRLWDYRQPKPADLEPADLEPADMLLSSLGINNLPVASHEPPSPRAIRGSEAYGDWAKEALLYFTNWREAARDGGTLLAVLRVTIFSQLLALLDAAQQAGWALEDDGLLPVGIPSANLVLPGFAFRAQPSAPISEEEALARWTWVSGAGNHLYLDLAGPLALALYRAIGAKRILGERSFRNEQGLLVRSEAGLVGALGYIFICDEQPNFRLMMTSPTAAEQEQRKWT